MRNRSKLAEKMAQNGFISISEAAESTGIPKTTLYDAVRTKRLKSQIVCDKYYVAENDLKNYLGEAASKVWEPTQSKRGSR